MKMCSKCKRNLPADNYHFKNSKLTKSGLYSSCKECSGNGFTQPKRVTKPGHKFCSKCDRELPVNLYYFYSDKECLYGVSSICKECRGHPFMEIQRVVNGYKKCNVCQKNLPYTKEFFYSSGETLRADCKECESKKTKIYYSKNAGFKRKYAREWYHEHCANNEEYKKKALIRSKNHRMTIKHTTKYKLACVRKSHNRRALKKDLPNTLTESQWENAKKQFDNKCAYCGKEKPLEQDHFVALKNGGEYTHNNIIPACKNCNCRKSAKDFFTWYPKFKHYSKKRETKILKYLGYTNGIQQLSLI